MPATSPILVFASAPEADVRRAVREVLPHTDDASFLWFHPEGSPFSKSKQTLCWGAGPFTWSRALVWTLRLRRLNPACVVLPLNNADGTGYGPLRLLARWLSPKALEFPKNGAARPVTWTDAFSEWETAWHAGAIRCMELVGPLFRLWLKRHVPDPNPVPPIPAEPETVQDHYTETPPEASIIIRTYNEERYLAATLEQIAVQEGPSREVIVIDSGSTDRTVEIACDYPVRVYRIPKAAFHYSATLNLGARLARGRYLVHLSAHSVPVDRIWLAALIQPLRDDDQIAGVCGKEVPLPDWASPFERKLLADMFPHRPRRMTESFFFSNANAAVRRDCVLEVPFDENIDWGEDQVWAHAMHQRGRATLYTPDSAVAHSHNLTMAQCFTRTLKFQRTLFRRMHCDRVDASCQNFRNLLPGRARSLRKFISEHRLASSFGAWFYAPFCEFVNYLGCDTARREWRANKLTERTPQPVYTGKEEVVTP